MAIAAPNRGPVKSLVVMLAMTLALLGGLAAAVTWAGGQWTPKLGLDLEGGTQMILEPQVREGENVNEQQLAQAVDIMRARVDGQGVAEAEVATLGTNVVVAVPGTMNKQQEEALRQSSQMRFRPVIFAMPTQQEPAPAPSPSPAPTGKPTPTGTAKTPATKPSAAPRTSAPASPAPTSAENAVAPAALRKGEAARPAAPSPPPGPTPSPNPTDILKQPKAKEVIPGLPGLTPAQRQDPAKLVEYATSEAWMTPENQAKLLSYDCAKPEVYNPSKEDVTRATVTCEADGSVKYLLGPAVINGDRLADAAAGPAVNQTGQQTGGYKVDLQMKDDAKDDYAAISRYMQPLPQPRNQLAVVLDNRVISAPYFQSAILDGRAEISGNFTADSAKQFADQLKFGALPISFTVQSAEQISPTVGGDQLRKGIVAGLIGLLLVVGYSLLQYRALGLVTVSSLLIVALLTYLLLALLGWGYNLRLTMAGVTGAIVAIGTTADSFIVYFERVRDELRDGRSLPAAVQTGWDRAKRTILVSDGVNLLAAVVLYVLASSNVRGFAFMLIVTTILDVIVTFIFTHPLLSILARTRFFGGGHKWSGFAPETLGVSGVRYVGRGRFATGEGSAAPVAAPKGSPA